MSQTPKTLDEAIRFALLKSRSAPLDAAGFLALEQDIYWHVRDYMAQKFGAMYLDPTLTPEQIKAVEQLFVMLVRRNLSPKETV